MPLYVLLIIAFAFLLAAAASYFFAKTKLFSFTLLLFYIFNACISFSLFYNHHVIIFYVIVVIFIALPIICLITFAFDVHYALFCIDTSFAVVVVWLLIPAFFAVNLIAYIVRIIHA